MILDHALIFATRSGSVFGFEAAVLFAMTGFVSIMTPCKYLLRESIVE